MASINLTIHQTVKLNGVIEVDLNRWFDIYGYVFNPNSAAYTDVKDYAENHTNDEEMSFWGRSNITKEKYSEFSCSDD